MIGVIMNTTEYEKEMFGEFPERTKEDLYLNELAELYHRKTEEYDRSVCTGPIEHNEIQPANDLERRLINRYALSVKQTLIDKAFVEKNITRDKVIEAIQRLSKY